MEIPSIKEELSRKALDALEELLLDREGGKITEAQFATGLNVLWTVASGLAGKGFFDLISMATVKKTDSSFVRAAFLIKGAEWAVVQCSPHDHSMEINTSGKKKTYPCDSFRETLDKFNTTMRGLPLLGYKIIART